MKESNGIYQHTVYLELKLNTSTVMKLLMRILLFKTHKIKPEELATTNVFNIPVRLLQSAGKITTSCVTTMIESILQPISAKFCQSDVNEYCKDSTQYITELLIWQNREWKTLRTSNFILWQQIEKDYTPISIDHWWSSRWSVFIKDIQNLNNAQQKRWFSLPLSVWIMSSPNMDRTTTLTQYR